MGCWDIFCFLCGNTCHEIVLDDEAIKQDIQSYENTKKSNWFTNHFKPVYELYKKDNKAFFNKVKSVTKNTTWLNKCTFLCADNRVVHNVEEVNCNIGFQDSNGSFYTHITQSESIEEMYGLFVHTDCWKFIKNTFKIELKYSDLPVVDVGEYKTFNFIKYGPIEKYWMQDFDLLHLIVDKNEELIMSPLKSQKVAKNIKKVFSKLKIRPGRTGPSTSASFYSAGTFKMGSDGLLWSVKNGKWLPIKETIKENIKLDDNQINKLLKGIVLKGDTNDKPLLVSKVKKVGKKYDLEVITTKEFIDKIKSKLN